jgi:antirestriction protein ArdC
MAKDIKKEIIDAITEEMEKSNRLPWDSGLLNGTFNAVNWKTGSSYHGINAILLHFFGKSETAEYMTFVQAKDANGKVMKGAKGIPVIKYALWNYTKKCYSGENDEKGDKIRPFIKRYYVFPVQSVEGVEPKREIKTRSNAKIEDIENAVQTFAANTNLKITNENEGTAYYMPLTHSVNVSEISRYKDAASYYDALLHELAHSTGKALGRKMDGNHGGKDYSKEEVVAEITCMMLCAYFGIESKRENSATYVAGWAQQLKKNPTWLFEGAAQAEKAFAYILEKMEITKPQPEADAA